MLGMKKILRYLKKRFFFSPQEKPEVNRDIPKEMKNDFTLNGKIEVKYRVLDDSYSSDDPVIYSNELVDSVIKSVKLNQFEYYGKTGKWLVHAVNKYNIACLVSQHC